MTAHRLKQTAFALRVTRRREGNAGIVYRRRLNESGQVRLEKIAEMTPEVLASGTFLIRKAVRATTPDAQLEPGPYLPIDEDWGVRVGCYAKACDGLQVPYRLDRTAEHLLQADPNEAAWWLGLMSRSNGHGQRAVRAFRILTEATE